MRKILSRLTLGVVAVSMIIGCTACGSGKRTYYNNETDPLVFSTLAVDGVFNPFFYTSGTDGNVVGLTQLSILSNDKNGNPVCGENEATIALDYQITNNGKKQNDGLETTYYFVLKNNVRFSDGSYLTMKDVFFNFYVYLDPAYTGSSTIYSTDIKGLTAYRTQARTEAEQKNFMSKFENAATGRVTALIGASEEILKKDENKNLSQEQFKAKLQEYKENEGDGFKYIVEDFDKACELFLEELVQDYSNSMDAYEETSFKNEQGEVVKPFKTDMEVFLYNENGLSWNKKDGKIECSYVSSLEEARSLTKDQAIQIVYDANIPNNISQVVSGWATATNLRTYLTNAELEIYSAGLTTKKVEEIEGIQFANRKQSVTVNGKEYGVPTYNADGSVQSGNEVLAITINNIDPKAIWNFALPIAPMSYYSDKAHVDAFDFDACNFGVEWGAQSFLQEVVNAKDKVGLPVGAGPYAASRSSGGIDNVKSSEFYSDGVIYYESNPYYIQGEPKIKKVRYQVVAANQMLNTLYNKEVDFVEPNAKPEIITELNGKKKEGYGSKTIYTAGYGYIGINAGKVPSIKVRQAIMHAIDVKECANYYGTEAAPLYRSMSKENWAYPEGATPYYPYIGDPVPEGFDGARAKINPDYVAYIKKIGKKAGDTLTQAEQEEFLRSLLVSAGYHEGSSGIYTDDTNVLKYTFTIAGNETDHPAFGALNHAREILNRVGFQITVSTDANALSKLSSGGLTVWAAAWSSTIDPDMYQVYHKDSKATSTLNWGYREILLNAGNKYSTELSIVNQLSDKIEEARENEGQTQRRRIYSDALDLVMQLAVELPTYQRKDLFAYNANKIDEKTFNQDTSSYKGLTSDMHLLSLIVEK